jgi:hypothetical protein
LNPRLHQLAERVQEKLRTSSLIADPLQLNDRSEVLKLISVIGESVEKAKTDAERFNRYQDVLQQDVVPFDDVDNLVMNFAHVKK